MTVLPVPSDVPPDLTRPSRRYRLLAGVVGICVVGFAVFYLGLMALLVDDLWLTWRLSSTGMDRTAVGVLFAPVAILLLLLLAEALWGVHRLAEPEGGIEVTAAQEPALFAVIHALADRVGAPRPRRVLLVPDVNAQVAFDSSIANLFVPTRKNLIIGLGLVNVLTAGQLIAVLAHEFGHFSQSSMSLGRWVYVANGVIERAVTRRGLADGAVQVASRLDFRLAIVGVGVALVMSLVRSAIGGLLWLINLPTRAMGREMELHADKVAVSLTGSDALIEALARLQQGDRALDLAASQIRVAASGKVVVRDLFRVQDRALAQLRPAKTSEAPADPGEWRPDPARRLFAADDAPPRMWATHPPNRVREDSAKSPYLPAPRDDRPAWALFADPERVRAEVTAAFYRQHVPTPTNAEPVDELDGGATLEGGRASIYAEDFVTVRTADPEAWIAADPPGERLPLCGEPPATDEVLVAALADRHGPSARATFDRRKAHSGELDQLMAFAAGQVPLEPTAQFRGAPLAPDEVAETAEQVRDELAGDLDQIARIHQRARTAARAAAARLGPGWVEAHRSTLGLLHFLECEELQVRLLGQRFSKILQVAGQASSDRGREARLCDALFDLHSDLANAVSRYRAVLADPPFPGGAAVLPDGLLPEPDLLSWSVPWVQKLGAQLQQAQLAASSCTNVGLNHLLDLEDRIEAAWLAGGAAEAPTGRASVPSHAAVVSDPAPALRELKVPRKVVVARTGTNAWRAGRNVAAAAAVWLVPLGLWLVLSGTELVLYNGTGQPQVVQVGGASYPLEPHQVHLVTVFAPWPVRATTVADGAGGAEVEQAWVPAAPRAIYNVGRRGTFYRQEVVYGGTEADATPPEPLGNPLILPTDAEYVLREPPRQIEASGKVRRDQVLDASGLAPLDQLVGALDSDQLQALLSAVLRFDPPDADLTLAAALLAQADPERARSLTSALRDRYPNELEPNRAYQVAHDGDPGLVDEYRTRSDQRPTAVTLYLYARLLDDPDQARAVYLRAMALDPGPPRLRLAFAGNALQLGRLDEIDADLGPSAPPGLETEFAELRVRARRAGGVRGVPTDLPTIEDDLLRGALEVEGDSSRLEDWIARLPHLEAQLRRIARDLEGAARTATTADDRLLLTLAGPSSGWADRLEPDADLSIDLAALGAAAAIVAHRPPDPFLAKVHPRLRPAIERLLANPPGDRAGLDALARSVDLRTQWAVYASAAVLQGDARSAELVEQARRLSLPWQVPPWP